MIAFIEGEVVSRGERDVIIKSGSVAWRVFVSRETLRHMPAEGKPIKLWTSFYIRAQEGITELYGFTSEAEWEFFELLNSVPGVGPKSALSVLDLAPMEQIKAAIASGNAELLTKVSGIGKKTAGRIVVDLKSKIKSKARNATLLAVDVDVIEALSKLGYTNEEARKALEKIPDTASTLSERVYEALKVLGK